LCFHSPSNNIIRACELTGMQGMGDLCTVYVPKESITQK
jgi:hypothetical protein